MASPGKLRSDAREFKGGSSVQANGGNVLPSAYKQMRVSPQRGYRVRFARHPGACVLQRSNPSLLMDSQRRGCHLHPATASAQRPTRARIEPIQAPQKSSHADDNVSKINIVSCILDLLLQRSLWYSGKPRAALGALIMALAMQSAPAATEDWRADSPGHSHRVNLAELPAPYTTPSSTNAPQIVSRPDSATLAVPPGFAVSAFATGLEGPRRIQIAPNGDIFVAETLAGRVRIVQSTDGDGKPVRIENFAVGLRGPFGIAFYPAGANPEWLYVATSDQVLRFAFRCGDLHPRGPAEVVVAKLANTDSGHTTRDLAFSNDGQHMFVSVGSGSNAAEYTPRKTAAQIQSWEATHALGAAWAGDTFRGDVLVFDVGAVKNSGHIFATGIRNCVGLTTQPGTGDLWCTTNERDGLGDDLVPDYATRVREGGFYGWPWYYIGAHEDPRHKAERPDLAHKVTTPDVLLQAHSAALTLAFYNAKSGAAVFPREYQGDAFVALHGSWNRSRRTGSKVVRIRFKDNQPTGEYEDFLTGFVVDNEHVWGRPVGVAVAHDGALLISDDVTNTLWRVAPISK
jgi:glucose/arabinose dehydrogenase